MNALEHILTNDLRRLHEDVLAREKSLLVAEKPGYLLYVVQVPGGKYYRSIHQLTMQVHRSEMAKGYYVVYIGRVPGVYDH